jgi:8-oxo-dGTP pyrophosphatase MutT (NUDIX family)
MTSCAFRIAVVTLIDSRSRILLQLRDGNTRIDPNRWCLPGGTVERGEDAVAAALRELFEETGLTPDTDLVMAWRGRVPSERSPGAIADCHVFLGWTAARQEDVQCNEGDAMELTPVTRLPALEFGRVHRQILPTVLASPLFAADWPSDRRRSDGLSRKAFGYRAELWTARDLAASCRTLAKGGHESIHKGIEQGEVLWIGPDLYPLEELPDGFALRVDDFLGRDNGAAGRPRVWVRGPVLLDTRGGVLGTVTLCVPVDQPRAKLTRRAAGSLPRERSRAYGGAVDQPAAGGAAPGGNEFIGVVGRPNVSDVECRP